MQSASAASLDLPLKFAIYENEEQSVVAYNDPQWLINRHQITDQQLIIEKLTQTLNTITDAAIV